MSLTLANKITIGRILIVPVFIAAMTAYTPEHDYWRWVALGVYLTAEVTDVIDGYIARRFRQKTRAGAILDPLADKLLFISALVCLYKVGLDHHWAVRIPLAMVVALLSRDVILIVGALLIALKKGEIEVRSNLWGKAAAFFQAVLVVALLLQSVWAMWILWGALFVTVVSGVIYMRDGIKELNNGDHH